MMTLRMRDVENWRNFLEGLDLGMISVREIFMAAKGMMENKNRIVHNVPLQGERGEDVTDVRKKGKMFLRTYADIGRKERTKEEKKWQKTKKREYMKMMQEKIQREKAKNGGEVTMIEKGLMEYSITLLKKKKMAGIDNVDADQVVEEMSPILEKVMEMIMKTGETPEKLKWNLILPIPKPGRAWDTPAGYRPINVLTSLAKVMDKVLAIELGAVTGVNMGQFAYQPGVSAENMMMEIREEMEEMRLRGNVGCLLVCDFSRAFERVNWWLLGLKLLKEFEVRAGLARAVMGFIKDRMNAVE